MALIFTGTACKNYFDINDNPNSATSTTVELVLPSALTATAKTLSIVNNYGGWTVGYIGLGGGLNGFSEEKTYNYTRNFYGSGTVDNTDTYRNNTNFWENAWRNLEDYEYIETTTAEDANYVYFNAVAKIMKAYNFQLLVDEYGDIPYTEALKGSTIPTPKYDDAATIYQDLIKKLDDAVALLQTPATPLTVALGASDVMFSGDKDRWMQFANTLKLRMLIRVSGVSALQSFVSQEFGSISTTIGFLSEDAMVNPGYLRATGQQNPYWERYHSSASGGYSSGTYPQYTLPTKYIYGFYNGNKLTDDVRGALIYRNFPNTPTVQLGDPNPVEASGSQVPAWYAGPASNPAYDALTGVLKGPGAGVPLILASESYFLQAEAALKGYLTSVESAESLFNEGIKASFNYLDKTASGSLLAGKNPTSEAAAYHTANGSSYLVNYNLAASDAQRLEAIITQKYIALNFIQGQEAWSEFRRTGYPRTSSNPVDNAVGSFVSLQSTSTHADKLPVRLLYPTSESYNQANVPSGVTPVSPAIFWDVN